MNGPGLAASPHAYNGISETMSLSPRGYESFLIRNARTAGARAGFVLVLSLVITLIVIVEIPGLTQWQLVEGDRIAHPVHAPRDVFTRQSVSLPVRQARLDAMAQFLDQVEQARRSEGSQEAWANIRVPDLSDALLPLLQALSPEDWNQLRRTIMDVLSLTDDLVVAEGNLEQIQLYALILLQERLGDPQLVQVAQMLVLPWIRPNTLTTAYAAGEEIASPAMPITQNQLATLSQLNLVFQTWFSPRFFLVFPLFLLLVSLLQWILPHYNEHILERKRELWALLCLILLLLVAVKIQIHQVTWVKYMLPVAAAGMLFRTLAGFRVALVVMIALAIITGFMAQIDLRFLLFMNLGTLTGVVALPQSSRIRHFVIAGIWVVAMNLLLLVPVELRVFSPLGFSAQLLNLDSRAWFQGPLLLAFVSLVNGVTASSLALAGTYAFGELTGRTTSFKLSELARPDHPLLILLRNTAPGTYHHTMRVSEMAERAAQVIGADALLTRVGAYFHDIGKIPQAYLFAENIPPGHQPHADYSPAQSACIIISHVEKGIEIGRQHGLPPRILDFIQEHHGTQLMVPFYAAALEAAAEGRAPDQAAFRYPGPVPRSRETSILLLADSCEATFRAARTDDPTAIRRIVEEQFALRLQDGSLARSPLTLGELSQTKDVVIEMLVSSGHQRIPYPDLNLLELNQLSAAGATSALAASPPLASRLPYSV